jgi:hypothetical protein
MKRGWIIPLIVALVAGVIAFGVTRRLLCQGADAGIDRLQDVSFLTRELKLSTDQARQIESLHAALGSKLTDCCGRLCAARARLGAAFADETDEGVRTEALLVEMCRVYEESERSTLENMRRVRAMLNVEQRKRFDAIITRCLCRACDSHGASGCFHSGAGR